MTTSRLFHSKSSAHDDIDQTAATTLGCISLALGATEILATRQLQRIIGVEDRQTTGVLRVLGVRELAHGVDLLTRKNAAPGLWARVAGDIIDGAVLTCAATRTRRPGGFLAFCAAVLPVVAADMFFAPRASARQ